jgi:hypothetical protein
MEGNEPLANLRLAECSLETINPKWRTSAVRHFLLARHLGNMAIASVPDDMAPHESGSSMGIRNGSSPLVLSFEYNSCDQVELTPLLSQ